MSETGRSAPEARDEALARLSFAFLLDEMVSGVAGLAPLDALLVLAINQANIAPLTRDPEARARYGQLDAPASDAERRPVPINAIAGSLGLPFETARRRVGRLRKAGVCVASRGGVVVPAAFLVSPAYVQSVLAAHERLRRFHLDLRSLGLIGPLPPPAYGLEGSVPVRAAARLLSDYILRSAEGLMREAGSVVSTMALLALLSATLGYPRDAQGKGPTATLRALSQTLQLPAETLRRHLAQLTDAGLCKRTREGFVVPPASLSRPGLQRLFVDNAQNVQRLLAGLAERGVILAWETGGALDGRQMA